MKLFSITTLTLLTISFGVSVPAQALNDQTQKKMKTRTDRIVRDGQPAFESFIPERTSVRDGQPLYESFIPERTSEYRFEELGHGTRLDQDPIAK